VQEAGGVAARLDGSPYRVGDDRFGLLVARDAACWKAARQVLEVLPDA
jgi:fructose-1,6-bisphosphatase/inositol monophosphatase family enzyme